MIWHEVYAGILCDLLKSWHRNNDINKCSPLICGKASYNTMCITWYWLGFFFFFEKVLYFLLCAFLNFPITCITFIYNQNNDKISKYTSQNSWLLYFHIKYTIFQSNLHLDI